MKITQEQKERILKLDPNFFDEKLEVWKWYKHNYQKDTIVYKVDNLGYGLFDGLWDDSWVIDVIDNWTLATEKEVEIALVNEAKKRGFESGVYFLPIGCTLGLTRHGNNFAFDMESNSLIFNNYCIFYNGKCAEIIETITLQEAEKLLNKKII